MRKGLCLLLAMLFASLTLVGCAKKEIAQSKFTAENEIITYQKIDPEKTQLTVSMIGNNAQVQDFSDAFMAANPDVQVVCVDITGGDGGYRPIVDWVVNGMAPDAMFANSDSFVDASMTEKYFVDFSTHPVLERFEMEPLQQLAINSNVYCLPAPAQINCMIYNKTLFDQYGWQPPATFDEFVALCLQIRQDTNGAVQPWNPNAKYDSVFSVVTEAFMYTQLFGGVENRAWYNDFCAGQSTFASHMEPFYDMLQTLIDNQLLVEEHFTYSATTRGKEFKQGSIAMLNHEASQYANGEYAFALMPYPTTEGELGYVSEDYSALFCVPKKEHTKAEQDALDRYIMFFGSTEGQQALIGETLMISKVKDVPSKQMEVLAGVADAIAQGHSFTRMDFPGAGQRTWTFKDDALAMVKGEKTGVECIAAIDAKPYLTEAETATPKREKLAQISNDLTIWEFSCYIADMYRETAGADIGLINHGVAYRGNLVRLFQGDFYDTYVEAVKPRSFANDSTLVKASMTGQQLLDALNHPVGNACVSNSVYAYSGLTCEIAPWNEPGQKYLSVKLADGSAIDPQKTYTVAMWAGTVADEYLTDTPDTFEGTWKELMTAKMKADGTIAPANDGRAKLKWD